MPTFTCGDVTLAYQVHGQGHPLLAFAPGGTRSSIAFWDRAPFHPVRELAEQFRVVVMDQRNAGASRAPVTAADGWGSYTEDHLALLDELGIDRCHVLGQCIGGAFALRLAATAPERVTAAVLMQPIGRAVPDNVAAFHEIFASWAEELARTRPDVRAESLAALRENLYGGDFVFSVSRDEVRRCPVPLLVLRGDDVYHPSQISEEVVRLAPRAELIERWKGPDELPAALGRVREFLATNTPP